MSFAYSSITRTLTVLGYTFENVALFEIEQYIEKAKRKHEYMVNYK